MRDLQEVNLLKRLQAGDERAMDELADAYRFKVYSLAFRYFETRKMRRK